MRSRLLALAGLAAVLAALTFPSWRALAVGNTGAAPRLAAARLGTACVLPREEMRASHMKLLLEWRDLVVRRGVRKVTMADGRSWRVSLTGTCLECHDDKAKFCDRCHEYASVSPTCWDCHVVPQARPGTAAADGGLVGRTLRSAVCAGLSGPRLLAGSEDPAKTAGLKPRPTSAELRGAQ